MVADAAEIAGWRIILVLAPDLVAAFDRFMIEPVETDKVCRAKIAIVEALNKIEYDNEDVFLARHPPRADGTSMGRARMTQPPRSEAAPRSVWFASTITTWFSCSPTSSQTPRERPV